MQDHHLIEKLARFNRERIPDRVVHARGSAAYGVFEVTRDVTQWTKAKFLAKVGKKTEVFLRFSTVALELGSADTVRDPRGFALKFYTEDGNYDLVGNNTPIFFLRDPLKFPDFIHSQKRDPYTHVQEPNNAWDFFSHSPEATHQFTWLFGDRGIPASYRHMDGFGSHTYQWVNAHGDAFWVKYHFKTDQGIRYTCALCEWGAPDHRRRASYRRREPEPPSPRSAARDRARGVSIVDLEGAGDAAGRCREVSLQSVRPNESLVLRGLSAAGSRQAGAEPKPGELLRRGRAVGVQSGELRSGIGPSPDKMLQGRLFSYGDTQRYRLGINHTRLPVNSPHAATAKNYGRDGAMRFDDNGGRAKNYEPNSYDGPVQSNEPVYARMEIHGLTAAIPGSSMRRTMTSCRPAISTA
jgi:catalase